MRKVRQQAHVMRRDARSRNQLRRIERQLDAEMLGLSMRRLIR